MGVERDALIGLGEVVEATAPILKWAAIVV